MSVYKVVIIFIFLFICILCSLCSLYIKPCFYLACPLLSFTMPKNVYCTFDSMCLGLECCINLKFALYMKVFKVWARFDPCATPQMLFTLGLDSYTYTIEIPANIDFDGMLFSQSFCVRITDKFMYI